MLLLVFAIMGVMVFAAFFIAMHQQNEDKKRQEDEKRYREEVLKALKDRK